MTWTSVVAELERIREDPEGASARSAATFAALAAGVDGRAVLADSFVLLPDMPAPEVEDEFSARAAPGPVAVPPLEPLITGSSWFDAVDANPFHGGLLSGLRAYA